jgi:ethanolamine utilization protein EutJ
MEKMVMPNEQIKKFEKTLIKPIKPQKGKKLYTGVDLGTAYIVLAVVDEEGNPVGGAMRFASVVKDGIVVDYMGAVKIVRELKNELEEKLECELELAGAAYPPGTKDSIEKTIINIAQAAELEVISTVDEPTAANEVLGINDGVVVDIGGGTTGTAILENGEVVHVDDEPTGGTHLSLVISGAYNVSFEEAEKIKTDPARALELLPVVKPVIQKMASIIKQHIRNYKVDVIYLAGGTSCLVGIEKIIEKEIGIKVYKPKNPFLVTPLGIALNTLY